MIQRFKGITANLDQWTASEKIIPDELWCVVNMPDNNIGLKIGNGIKTFSELSWIIDPRKFDAFINKPIVENPSATKFLNEQGEYIDLNGVGEFDLDTCLSELNTQGLEIPTKEEVAWIRDQMYTAPVFTNFTSTSSYFTQVPMGTSIQGTLAFNWNINARENTDKGNIQVSEGTWEGGSNIDLGAISSANLTLLSTAIQYSQIKTLTFTLTGKDTKGNNMNSCTLQITWTHKLYWGTSDVKSISDITDLTNRNSSMQNTRYKTITFNPVNQQYSIIVIPDEIPQDNINIVNQNAAAIDHSFNMNSGNGGTESLYNLQINGILYRAYVTYSTTASSSTAIIK